MEVTTPMAALILHDAATKSHLVDHFVSGELPGIAFAQPALRQFHLLAVFDFLAEHAVFVADTIANSRQIESGDGVEDAGGKPTQAAVAQGGIVLQFLECLQVQAELFQRINTVVSKAYIEQGVIEATTDKKFQRQVVDPLRIAAVVAPLGLHPALDESFAYGVRERMQPVFVIGGVRVLTDGIDQSVVDRALQTVDVRIQVVVIKGVRIKFAHTVRLLLV